MGRPGDALRGLADGTRTGKREQTVLTDDPILDFLSAFWGRTALDPCAPPDGPVMVPCTFKRKGKHPDGEPGTPGACPKCGGLGYTRQYYTLNPDRTVRLPEDGLAIEWPRRTFCNPPYANLRPWLEHGLRYGDEVIWYVPARPHRTWWREWAQNLDALVFLNPQKFKGCSQAFPAPLVLGYRGDHPVEFIRLAQDLGLGDRI